MARIRKISAYPNLERPSTRISKYKNHNFVRGRSPHLKLTRLNMGDARKSYNTVLRLNSTRDINSRQNALESARMVSNRLLEKNIGNAYNLIVKVYPFHVLRENPL